MYNSCNYKAKGNKTILKLNSKKEAEAMKLLVLFEFEMIYFYVAFGVVWLKSGIV